MQTVVMSFARDLHLGKPELSMDHVHVYFPVQIAHKVIAQCKALKLEEGSLLQRDTGTMWITLLTTLMSSWGSSKKDARVSNTPHPGNPNPGDSCEEGMLDASFGQIFFCILLSDELSC